MKSTMITQLDMCKVKLQHNIKPKFCKFFVLLGNRQALLGMPTINMLCIITINFNTIDTWETDKFKYKAKSMVIDNEIFSLQVNPDSKPY